MHGCHSELLLECFLEVALAGVAEVIADDTHGLIRILQKATSFLQLAAVDEGRNAKTQLLLEIGGEVRTAESDVLCNVGNGKGQVCVLLDEVDGSLNSFIGGIWGLGFVNLLRKGVWNLSK